MNIVRFVTDKTEYDEAIEELIDNLDDVIIEMFEKNTTNVVVEVVKCRKYEYGGSDDYDCETITEYNVDLYDELGQDFIEALVSVGSELINGLKNNIKKDI